MVHKIPMYVPSIGTEELDNLRIALAANELIRGTFATQFETNIADYVGTRYAVGTNSGTAALHMALLASGVEPDDEVFITTMTFIAPANAITYVRAHPVFIDVEEENWQMDPVKMEAFIDQNCFFDGKTLLNRNSGRKVSAIIIVHFLGMAADVDFIMEIAARYNLHVIEDAAQALGTMEKGRQVGGIAPVGCFSFYGNKLITAGGGGMLVTHDQALAKKVRYLVNQAKDDPIETLHKKIGFNYRMTNIHGAIGCAQFDRMPLHIAAKRAIAARYAEELGETDGITMLRESCGDYRTYWLSCVRIDPNKFGMSARTLRAKLEDDGIEALPLYQPLHLSGAHAGAQFSGGIVAEQIYSSCLTLPSSVGLNDSDQDRVIASIKRHGRT